MPLVVYSLLRLALFGACWAGLWWAGLHPLVAGAAAALLAWAVSYVVLPGPRDAAARWLAGRAAERATHPGRPHLSPRAQQDAADEDALIEEQDEEAADGESQPDPGQRA